MRSVASPTAPVKSKTVLSSRAAIPFRPSELVPLVLRRNNRDEIFYGIECSVCARPIVDFKNANIVVLNEGMDDVETLIPIGTEADVQISRIAGRVVAVHKPCDNFDSRPWTNASNVFKRDQRYAWEKRA